MHLYASEQKVSIESDNGLGNLSSASANPLIEALDPKRFNISTEKK